MDRTAGPTISKGGRRDLENSKLVNILQFRKWQAEIKDTLLHLLQNFQPPWPISQTLRWKNASIWNHSVLQNGELSFPNGWNSIYRFLFCQSPKYRFILIQYTNVYLCAKFGEYQEEKALPNFLSPKSNFLKFGPVSEQGAEITQKNCNFIPPNV